MSRVCYHGVPRSLRTSPMVYHAQYVPVPWCTTLGTYQSHSVPRSVRTSPMVSHAQYIPVLWCLTLRKYQSHCVPRSVRTSPIVYHDQSHGVSRSVSTSPMAYHTQCVLVQLCTTLRTYQSHCVHAQCVGYQSHGVPHSVRTSCTVYHALNVHQPSRSLGASHEKLLKIPKTSLKTFHQFSFLAPRVWNSLPADLRNTPPLPRLKSHLFRLAFNQSVYVCVCFPMRGYVNIVLPLN